MLRRNRGKEAKRESAGPGAVPKPGAPRPSRDSTSSRKRRLEPATEDQAMYSCECGFIFQAAVSTSVGCPHCGGSQAW